MEYKAAMVTSAWVTLITEVSYTDKLLDELLSSAFGENIAAEHLTIAVLHLQMQWKTAGL